jgi:hypothetical protein
MRPIVKREGFTGKVNPAKSGVNREYPRRQGRPKKTREAVSYFLEGALLSRIPGNTGQAV